MQPIRKDEKLTTADISKSAENAKTRAEEAASEQGEPAAESAAGKPQLVTKTFPGSEASCREARSMPLFPESELQDMRSRWDQIQASFVDQPRQSVEEADNLVATAIKRLAEQFADERSKVERLWTNNETVSTEDLRQALRRYRSFFERVLSA